MCWCGGGLGHEVAPRYRRCTGCGSAILTVRPSPPHFDVTDDEHDFYGRTYWTEFATARNLPTIGERAHADLSERCAFWIDRLLEIVQPPGRVLEIGCGHGGFVRLLRELGFDAVGTELSPWVAAFARRRFDVPVLQGPLEDLSLERGFRCVAAFDVLEHLRDPLDTTRRCLELLACDGILVLQTPCYRGEGPEWSMFQPDEHIHLFSERAICLLLHQAGFESVVVQPSLFPYDMWVVARPRGAVAGAGSPGGEKRIPAAFEALLDLRRRLVELNHTVARIDADRAERLAQVDQLTQQSRDLARRLTESDADRAMRLEQVQELTRRLNEVTGRLVISEADREARLEQVLELTRRLGISDADRDARLGQIGELTRRLGISEADRAAGLEHIEELRRRLTESDAAQAAGRKQIEELTRRLGTSEVDRAGALERIADLTRRLASSDADREAQLGVIQKLQAELEAIRRTWVWRGYRTIRPRGRPK